MMEIGKRFNVLKPGNKDGNESPKEDTEAHGTHVTGDSVVRSKHFSRLSQETIDQHDYAAGFIRGIRMAIQDQKEYKLQAGVSIMQREMERMNNNKNVQESLKIAKRCNIIVEVRSGMHISC